MSSRGPRNFRYRGNPSRFVVNSTFDQAILEPQVFTSTDDSQLTKALLSYHESLMPATSELQALQTLVNRLCEIIDTSIVNPVGVLSGQIEEIRPVGSFKLGTMLGGHSTADVVMVTRTLPTAELLTSIQSHLQSRLQPVAPSTDAYHICIQFYGFSVTQGASIVRVFVTTLPANVPKSNAEIHVNPQMQKSALDAIRQARWLEENASHITIKVLIRIIKDFRRRFKAFQYLSSWMISLLAVYAVTQNPSHQPLPINQAFRRFLQLLSSGMLLPSSTGVVDPCDPAGMRLHRAMSPVEQDELCCTAQTLLRALLHGAHKVLFEFDEYGDGVTTDDFVQAVADDCGVSIQWSEPVATSQDTVEASPGLDKPAVETPVVAS